MKNNKEKIKIKEKIKNKNKNKNKNRLNKVFGVISIVALSYLSISFTSEKFFYNKIDNQMTTEMYDELKFIDSITKSSNSFSHYVENYNYTEVMFQKDLKKLKNYDVWFVEKYKNFLKSENLIDPSSNEEIIQRMNNDPSFYLRKFHYFDRIFTGYFYSDRNMEFEFYSQYLKFNDPQYSKLKDSDKYRYVIKILNNSKKKYGLTIFNNDSMKDINKYKLFTFKKDLINNSNVYAYFNLLGVSKLPLEELYLLQDKLPKNERDNYTNLVNELMKKYNNKEINEYQLKNKIYDFIYENIQRLQYDRDFQYETLKIMHILNELSHKLEGFNNPNSTSNYEMFKKMEIFLLPQFYLLKDPIITLPNSSFDDGLTRKDFSIIYSGVLNKYNINTYRKNQEKEYNDEIYQNDYFDFLK